MFRRLLIFFSLISLLLARDKPYPICDTCLPTSVREAPGIGFDLSFTYGTSSVHFYNNTQLPLAHIPTTKAYRSLLLRLSQLPDKEPSCNPFCRLRRRLNKLLGRPATPDVGTLASVLSDLKFATESVLGEHIDNDVQRVAVSVPPFKALPYYDIEDAMEYIRLKPWEEYYYYYPPELRSAPTAYAGNGNGLCENYLNPYSCYDETLHMPTHYVFAVTYTSASLSWQLILLQDAFFSFYSNHPSNIHSVSFNLGQQNASADPSYWSQVEDYIYRGALHRLWDEIPFSKLLLLGESATDSKFLLTLRTALAKARGDIPGFPPQSPQQEILMGCGHPRQKALLQDPESIAKVVNEAAAVADPLFAASRGAAVYARWRQEMPYECREPYGCRRGEDVVAAEDELSAKIELR